VIYTWNNACQSFGGKDEYIGIWHLTKMNIQVPQNTQLLTNTGEGSGAKPLI
jgi:hypothetical protein